MPIEQRLEKLERTVRRYQLAFGILGLALLATTAIACSQQALASQKNAASEDEEPPPGWQLMPQPFTDDAAEVS